MKSILFFVAAGLLPSAAMSQAQQVVTQSAAVDPARLAAARGLIDQIFPPETREQMMQGMMASMSANIRQSFIGNPEFAKAISTDPRVKPIFDKFMDRQFARSTALINAGLPGMSEAMARAYARRFDLAQLRDLSTFFASPTGQIYTKSALTIMSDPDIAEWQRGLMTKSMSNVQGDVGELTKEILALEPPVKSK